MAGFGEDEQGFRNLTTIGESRRGRRTALAWMFGLCVLAALGLGLGVGVGGGSKTRLTTRLASRPTSRSTSAVSTTTTTTPGSTSDIASPAAVSAFVALLAPDPHRTMSATYTVSLAPNAPISQTVWTGHGMSAFSSRDSEGPFEVIAGPDGNTLCNQRGGVWKCVRSPSSNGFTSWELQGAPNLIAHALAAQLELWQNFSEELRITGGQADGFTVRCLESIPAPEMLIGPLRVCVTPQGIPVSFSGTDQDNGSQLTVGLDHLVLDVPQDAFDPPAKPADLTSCTDAGLKVSGSFNQGGTQQWFLFVSFENISDLPCSMSGSPDVVFAAADGAPVAKPATADGEAGTELILDPGSSAGASVSEWIAEDLSGSGIPCSPVHAAGLRVTPPGQTSAVFVTGTGPGWDTAMTTCSAIAPSVSPLMPDDADG